MRSVAGAGEDASVFAARSHGRARIVATVVLVGAVLVVVVAGLVVLAFLHGPDPRAVHLPLYESYDEPGLGGSSWLIGSGTPSVGAWPLVLFAGLLSAVALAAAVLTGRRYRARTGSDGTVARGKRAGRWWAGALVVVLVGLTAGLVANRYATDSVAADRQAGPGPVALSVEVGPVMDVRANSVRSVRSYRRHVALTFDDGPDPRWTRAILAVLTREHVVGTFFAVGEQVARHPEVAREVVAAGDEIGVHTYRHLEVTAQSPADLRRDLRLTQLAIIGATGHSTALFRPPFVAGRNDVGIRQYVALVEASRLGYLSVLADRDSTDWSRPGVATIIRRSLPRFGAGAVVELHDGGGDRSQTVAALTPLIRQLKRAGYQFETVSGMARLSQRAVMPVASLAARIWGGTSLWFLGHSGQMSTAFFAVVLLAAVLSLLRVLLTIVWSRYRDEPVLARPAAPVSVVIAAYDEAAVIGRTLAAVAALGPVVREVIVVDDGSGDGTAGVARSFADARVRVIERPHAGKARALRAGFAASRCEIVVTVDADTCPAPDALGPLLAPFGDPRVGAVSGNLRAANPRGALGVAQQLEYVIANAFERRALDRWSTQVTVPGAIGAFRRTALAAAGGIRTVTVAEDTDLTLAVVDAGRLVRFAPGARASTQVPESVVGLWRQRSRWSFGIAQSLWSRRHMARDPFHRPRPALTWIGAFFVHVALPLTVPLLDLAALWSLLVGQWWPVGLWLVVASAQFVAAVVAVRREGAPLRLLWAFPLHLFGYRQITALVVPQAVAWAIAGCRPDWGRPTRAVVASPAAREATRYLLPVDGEEVPRRPVSVLVG